jgi:CheY-like chemotaxis protein
MSDLSREQRDHLEALAGCASDLTALIGDILDMSRIEAGKIDLSSAPYNLPLLLTECVNAIRPLAGQKSLDLQLSIHPAAPEWVDVDASRLKQVLLNLLVNAVKFTGAGSVRLVCGVEAAHSVVRFEVHDTGCGIDEEGTRRLFRRFSQLDPSAGRRHAGLGLGLAIARELVELMGGEIGVESEPGRGSCFWCTARLPVISTPERSTGVELPANSGGETGLRVLLVEDNSVNRVVAAGLLRRMSCEVGLAENGNQALTMLKEYGWDLVLMDCQMPGMDGFETTRSIRSGEADRSRIPIIALTANAMDGDRRRCLDAGMDDYLPKPIDFAALRHALARWGPQTRREELPAESRP